MSSEYLKETIKKSQEYDAVLKKLLEQNKNNLKLIQNE